MEAFTVHRLLKFRGRPERDAKDDKAKEDAETEMLGEDLVFSAQLCMHNGNGNLAWQGQLACAPAVSICG